MALQPTKSQVDRATTSPFLLRLFYRTSRALTPDEFSIAPPADTTDIPDYTALLPASIRQQSVQIYTWPTCSLSELTSLMMSVVADKVLPEPRAGTRLVFSLIFPDTRGAVSESGRGRWVDRPLGSVVIGAGAPPNENENAIADDEEDAAAGNGPSSAKLNGVKESDLTGDADKTLADARFVIGDYVACAIYPPLADGRIAPLPPTNRDRGPRETYVPPRGGPMDGRRDNGYGPPRGGGFGGGYGSRGPPPPMGDWRRGERPPGGGYGGGGGFGGGGGNGGGYRGGRGRPY